MGCRREKPESESSQAKSQSQRWSGKHYYVEAADSSL